MLTGFPQRHTYLRLAGRDAVPNEIQVNAIAFKEGDAWVAQGIEYDIVAHAAEITSLPEAFARAVLENMCIAQHLGRASLEGIKPGPDRFREMFAEATLEMRSVRKPSRPPGPEVAVRVLETRPA